MPGNRPLHVSQTPLENINKLQGKTGSTKSKTLHYIDPLNIELSSYIIFYLFQLCVVYRKIQMTLLRKNRVVRLNINQNFLVFSALN